MKKLLLLVFTATLVLFFTPTSYAQRSSSVKVANNAELVKALNNPNVNSVEITQPGFYDELLLNANEGTFVFKGNGSRANCQYWINTHNVCFDGDTTTNVAESGVTSVGGATCPGVNEGHWTVANKPAGSTVTFMDPISSDTMHFYVDMPGVYELKNTWYSTPGDPSSTFLGSAQTQYTFYSEPVITQLEAAPDSVCGLSTTINFNYDVGTYNTGDTTVTWMVNGADSSAVYPKAPGSFNFTVPSCGTYTLNLHVTNSLGCGNADSTITIYFFDTPVVDADTTAGDTTSVCGLTYGFAPDYAFNCANGVATSTAWTSTATGATWSNDTVTVADCGTYTFYYTVVNGPCSATDSIVVKFFDTPVVDADTLAGDTISVCGLTYEFSPDYTIQCDNGVTTSTDWTGIGTWNNDSVTVTSCGIYTYYYTVVNGPCSTTDSIVVKFFDAPVVDADTLAGDTVSVCGLTYGFAPSYTIACDNGETPATSWMGTGTWSNDTVTVASCGTYTYYYTVQVGPCSTTDSIVVKFFDTPVVSAGVGDTICGLTASLAGTHTEACTNGETPSVQWTKVSGPGHVVFDPASANQDNVNYEVDSCGAYTFRYTVTNGPCVDSADVSFFFTDTPTITIDLLSDTVCGFTTSFYANYTAHCLNGDSAYMTGVGTDSITYDAASNYYTVYVDSCGPYDITYHVVNGPCSVDSTFTIVFYETPNPTINGDTAVYTCSTTEYYPTDPGCNDPAGITYTWNVSGGIFAGGATIVTTTGNTPVQVTWDQDYNIGGQIAVHADVSGVTGCGGDDTVAITKMEPTLEGQVKYWNDVETYMPSPFSTDDYYTIPFDYFYVTLYRDNGQGMDSLATAYVQPRLMEDLNELMSYFNFNLDTYMYGCDAKYYLKVWDGGFVYHDNPAAPAENTILGNNYTYNNWGGVNATDALAIQLMAASTEISAAPYNYAWVGLQGDTPAYGYYSFGIADVNQTTGITALDALTAKYRAVGLLGSYPDNGSSNQFAPNFMVTGRMVDSLPEITFPKPFDYDSVNDVPFTHSGNEYMYFQQAINHKYTSDSLPWGGKKNYINLYYESVGDINASYVPPGSGLKTQSNMELTYSGLASTQVGEEMTIPVSVDRAVEAGAVTLSFNYRNDLIEVLGTNYSDDDMFINQEDGVLNIAWFSTTPLELNENATIAQIRVRVLAEIPAGTELFSLNAITEIADANANPIGNVNLKTIGVTTDKGIVNGTELTTSNYPNPFDNATTISYTLPENGKVKVDVYNSVGMLVTTLVDEYQESGVQNAVFTSGDVKPGVYFYHITVQGETNNYSAVKRMIVVH